MLEKRKKWRVSGKERSKNTLSYVEYKEAKRIFRCKHRNVVKEYEGELWDELETAAELDQRLFWSTLRRKRDNKGIRVNELKTDKGIYRETGDIINAWKEHFEILYSPKMDPGFDHNQVSKINESIQRCLSSYCTENDDILIKFTESDVYNAIKSLKYDKAGGIDGIVNEHIKLSGFGVIKALTLLYNKLYEMEHIPDRMKKGMIITIHRGSNKHADELTNYRGITLLPGIYKLMERIIINKIDI
jgi:hypothetical protein